MQSRGTEQLSLPA